jgi:hypothetical protein
MRTWSVLKHPGCSDMNRDSGRYKRSKNRPHPVRTSSKSSICYPNPLSLGSNVTFDLEHMWQNVNHQSSVEYKYVKTLAFILHYIVTNWRKFTACSSETSVLTRITRRNIPEDAILHSHRRENIKSYKVFTSFLVKFPNGRSSLSSGFAPCSHASAATVTSRGPAETPSLYYDMYAASLQGRLFTGWRPATTTCLMTS